MGADTAPLLDVHGLSLDRRTGDGVIRILDQVDLRLEPGQWLAVLGANGAGKSSLLKYLAGDDTPLQTTVAYMAQDPDDQLIAGTVAGEITLGHRGLDPQPVLREYGLDALADLDPRLLAAGQKQRLALAVVTGHRPGVILCDEPTALQDDRQAVWVLDRLDRWRRETGGGLITATCDLREAERADRLLVLEAGRVVRQGPRAELLDSEAVRGLLKGIAPAGPVRPPAPFRPGEPVLELRGVGCAFLGPGEGFGGVELTVAAGERVGIVGPNGCGKSTLLAVCAGLQAPGTGSVTVAGRPFYAGGGQDLDHGLVMLAPQFPEYMFCRNSVAQELRLGPLPPGIAPRDFLASLGLPPGILDRNPYDLSSGQKRRLALGLVARSGRPLLLVDEPTAALDRRGRELVGALLTGVSGDSALVIASHDHGFLADLGCRILALQPGEKGLAAPVRGC